jgi:hypothetical protein
MLGFYDLINIINYIEILNYIEVNTSIHRAEHSFYVILRDLILSDIN